jgi:hypothetical protein
MPSPTQYPFVYFHLKGHLYQKAFFLRKTGGCFSKNKVTGNKKVPPPLPAKKHPQSTDPNPSPFQKYQSEDLKYRPTQRPMEPPRPMQWLSML